jgi:putative endonuclease
MPAPPQAWFVYLARCADGSLYTGIALDVTARIAAHDAGRGARYTRGRGPLTVCAVRRCASKSLALRLELQVKRLSRARKEALTLPRRLAAFARTLGPTTPKAPAPRRKATRARPG